MLEHLALNFNKKALYAFILGQYNVNHLWQLFQPGEGVKKAGNLTDLSPTPPFFPPPCPSQTQKFTLNKLVLEVKLK